MVHFDYLELEEIKRSQSLELLLKTLTHKINLSTSKDVREKSLLFKKRLLQITVEEYVQIKTPCEHRKNIGKAYGL